MTVRRVVMGREIGAQTAQTRHLLVDPITGRVAWIEAGQNITPLRPYQTMLSTVPFAVPHRRTPDGTTMASSRVAETGTGLESAGAATGGQHRIIGDAMRLATAPAALTQANLMPNNPIH